MFINEVSSAGHPICTLCSEDVLPNTTPNLSLGRHGSLVSGPKGMAILHNECVENYNAAVLRGEY